MTNLAEDISILQNVYEERFGHRPSLAELKEFIQGSKPKKVEKPKPVVKVELDRLTKEELLDYASDKGWHKEVAHTDSKAKLLKKLKKLSGE